MQSDVKTFRGRTLAELPPRIREELGPNAIVLRRREGLAGGVGGFFQRSYVEVDARPALPDTRPTSSAGTGEAPLEVRSDRATTEGMAEIQTLVAQASPFADALASATAVATPQSARA